MSVPLFRDMIVQLTSPGIKIPIEAGFNFNLFKKKKIQEYEGQTIPIHLPGGKTINVPAYMEYGLRQLRLVNEVDRFLDQSVDLSDEARWARVFLGRSYPYEPEKQAQWWKYKLNTQIRELEGHQARAEKKLRRSFSAGDGIAIGAVEIGGWILVGAAAGRDKLVDDLVERFVPGDALANPMVVGLHALAIEHLLLVAQHIGPFQRPEVGEFGAFQQGIDELRAFLLLPTK